MLNPKLLLVALLFVCYNAVAQTKNCKEIDVSIEIVKTDAGQSSLTIHINERGQFRVQLLDSKGKVTELHSESTILAKGEYDVIITDRGGRENRCPFYKRIKIDGQ